MWYPDREKCLKPGVLGKADISLYPFSRHILSLLKDSFDKKHTDFDIMGLHWRGGEEDTSVQVDLLQGTLEKLYTRMIKDFREDVGKDFPFVFHTIECKSRLRLNDPTGRQTESMNYINSVFRSLSEQFENVSVFNPETLSVYDADAENSGLYEADLVHFTKEANRLTALRILEDYRNEKI